MFDAETCWTRDPLATANLDRVFVGDDIAFVLDGVTEPPGNDTGCRHGTSWYVDRLAALLVEECRARRPLPDVVYAAVARVRELHSASCDIENPMSPASTVTLVRWLKQKGEYFVLGDSPLLVVANGLISVLRNSRTEWQHITQRGHVGGSFTLSRVSVSGDAAASCLCGPKARVRHAVASSCPAAVRSAATGTVGGVVESILLMTDGAARGVEVFGSYGWAELTETVRTLGLRRLVDGVRDLERSDPLRSVARRKCFDDASAILLKNFHSIGSEAHGHASRRAYQ